MNPFSLAALSAVASGAVFGALLRYGVSVCLSDSASRFPMATLLVNAFGSLMAGVVLVMVLKGQLSENWRLFLLVGLCGALTTFSSFALETFTLLQQGEHIKALVSVTLNVLCSLVFAAIGFWITKQILI